MEEAKAEIKIEFPIYKAFFNAVNFYHHRPMKYICMKA
jgi:hypothetical protein